MYNNWVEEIQFSPEAGLYRCENTERRCILKPRTDKYTDLVPIAANEFIVYELLMLLRSKGVDVDVAEVRLQSAEDNNLGHDVAIIDYLGEHSRVSSRKEHDYKIPDWLCWFDKWIARLDCAGDTNLILPKGSDKVIPVDFAMSFTWTYSNPMYCHKLDDFDIRIGDQVVAASSLQVKQIIQSITDKELKSILFNRELDKFLLPSLRASYYTGLCFRRDHLK